MRNKKDQLFWGVILAIVAGTLFYSIVAYGQPPAIPANPAPANITPAAPPPAPAPAPAPAPPVVARPQPQPAPQTLSIPPYVAQAIKEAIANLPSEDANSWAGLLRTLAVSHPTLALLIGLRGLFGIIGLPIHTWLDRYLQKHLSADQYAKVHTDGTSAFKVIDWLVNLVFSIKPSTVMAASSIPKSSVAPTPASIDEAVARALARYQSPPPAIPPDPILKQ